MKAVSKQVYDRIDNDVYNVVADKWWSDDTTLIMLQTSINPLRVGYSKRKLLLELNIYPTGKTALEVGCGGGILTEEIARMGFATTGIEGQGFRLEPLG
jgi:2-polyprenyl-6-hydroxyphenyl methylase / 3-demethylubiquinone-9 3-methyltransferase